MRVVWDIVIVALLIGVNALLAMSEIALVSANRTRLAALETRGVPAAAGARLLAETPDRFIPVLQAGVTLVGVLLGVFGGEPIARALEPLLVRLGAVLPFSGTLALVIAVVAVTLLTLLLGELVPKQLALRAPERFAMLLAGPVRALTAIGWPLVWVLSAASRLVLHGFGAGVAGEDVTEEELKVLLAEGERSGVIETEERDMIERVLRLADKPARAIMTPRTELVWIDRTDSEAEILHTIASSRQARFVVCDGRVDNVVGVVRAKEVLAQKVAGGPIDLALVLAKPLVIPDTITALDALERFRGDELGLALVLDEYGSFEGVVTATDVLDAIVGDPEDAAPARGATPDGGEARELLLDGLMPVDEAKARLALPALPSEGQYHTLGGLLLALLRRVPRVGDRIVFGGWQFEVLAMDGRRVERVRASREEEAQPPIAAT